MLRGGGSSSFWNQSKYHKRSTISYSIRTWLFSFLGKEQYRLANTWTDQIEDLWLARFIQGNFNHKKKVLLLTCFEYPIFLVRYSRAVRIFFTGENLQSDFIPNRPEWYGNHRLDEVDLALGFEFRSEEKYYRFPQWLYHRDFISPTDTLEDIRNKISALNDPKRRLCMDRTRFIGQISSHDWGGQRSVLIDLLSPLGQIDCAGRFRKSTNELQERYHDVKEDFLANYRFNICPENSLGDGYMTEKIFESIAAGCIPIYWGAYLEEGILNPKAILRYEEGKEEELYKAVERLWTDDEAYREFAMQPPFEEGAAERIWEMIQGLKQRLEPLLKA